MVNQRVLRQAQQRDTEYGELGVGCTDAARLWERLFERSAANLQVGLYIVTVEDSV
jgi:hypothetical protein